MTTLHCQPLLGRRFLVFRLSWRSRKVFESHWCEKGIVLYTEGERSLEARF
jgi:hypothetical protein